MNEAQASSISTHVIQAANQVLHLIARIELFGSMTRGVMQPNDCDLAIVSMTSHKSPQWGELRLAMPSIVEATTQNLGVPVNIVLLTPGEWDDLRPKFFSSSICVFSLGCAYKGYLP